jgi:urease accessory protein
MRTAALPGIILPLLLLAASPALAHTGVGVIGGFQSGFQHPIFGIDHLLAMVAVGIWGAQLGSPAIWALPIAFPLIMTGGGLLALAGVGLPMVETTIAASVVVLGALIAIAARLPIWLAVVVVAIFALSHGHAHGTELPAAADPIAYSLGFVVATGMLHAIGIVIGLLIRWPHGALALRVGGGAICAAGLWLLSSHVIA